MGINKNIIYSYETAQNYLGSEESRSTNNTETIVKKTSENTIAILTNGRIVLTFKKNAVDKEGYSKLEKETGGHYQEDKKWTREDFEKLYHVFSKEGNKTMIVAARRKHNLFPTLRKLRKEIKNRENNI